VGMKQTLDVINSMEADGVIERYAIAGAVAAYNYIEPAVTSDLDILVSFGEPAETRATRLISLDPIYSYLRAKGYDQHRKEGIVIEGWPVQFLPVASRLDREALARAEDIDVELSKAEGTVKTRILRPEHIMANALRVGRPQDLIRIAQFLQENAVDVTALCALLDRHSLRDAWQSFCRRAGIADPCDLDRS
jgi:predicted nucleotidyltransferase